MLTLATFFPVSDSAGFNLSYETMRSVVDVMDILGLHFTISYILTGKGEVRVFAAGLGWATAHSLLTYFLLLFVGARTTGFSWRYIQASFESNIDLVFYLCLATLVWVYNRHDQHPFLRHLTSILLLFCITHSLTFQVLFFKFSLRSWDLLAAKAAMIFGLTFCTIVAYSGVGKQAQLVGSD